MIYTIKLDKPRTLKMSNWGSFRYSEITNVSVQEAARTYAKEGNATGFTILLDLLYMLLVHEDRSLSRSKLLDILDACDKTPYIFAGEIFLTINDAMEKLNEFYIEKNALEAEKKKVKMPDSKIPKKT